jgi:hypothetical protein
MTEDKEFIHESIISQIRMGFLSIEEIQDNIIEEIEDNGFEYEISEEWAFKQIDKEWKTLITESKQWQRPTDTERLVEAFDTLCKSNIIALHNAGYETSDGEYEVVEVERELRKNNIMSDGYCFYHGQDLESALNKENPCLYIAFQKIENNDDNVTINVGKRVVEVLKRHGFEVDWNEKPTRKILIPNFKWQLVYNENNRDLLDYDEVITLMIK